MDAKVLAPYGQVEELEKPPSLDANLAVLQDSVRVRWRCFKELGMFWAGVARPGARSTKLLIESLDSGTYHESPV